jgi:uncharacterized protein YdeI (YjbR/CyaY-like superfamily)
LAKQKRNIEECFDPSNRQEWRQWLKENYPTARRIWLIIRKKNSNKKGVTLEEAIEEAIAFGWIDSKMNTLDQENFRLLFSPRKKGSIWSKSNKLRVEKLTRTGLMTPAGLAKAEEAKGDGSWNRLDVIEELRLPEDFKEALSQEPLAQKNFEAFSDSSKKQILWWIESAKLKETRLKRISQVVSLAAENKKR